MREKPCPTQLPPGAPLLGPGEETRAAVSRQEGPCQTRFSSSPGLRQSTGPRVDRVVAPAVERALPVVKEQHQRHLPGQPRSGSGWGLGGVWAGPDGAHRRGRPHTSLLRWSSLTLKQHDGFFHTRAGFPLMLLETLSTSSLSLRGLKEKTKTQRLLCQGQSSGGEGARRPPSRVTGGKSSRSRWV